MNNATATRIRHSAKRRARISAMVEISEEPSYFGTIDRYVETLDDDPRFRHLKFRTLVGAVRAAARQLGRYDAKADAISPAR